jgi:putative FmdB family regulatory protein
MPVYDYVCGACRHRFEVFRGLNEAGPHQCPLCEGPVTRAFAPPTILFKGSGWAKVDRRATSAPAKRSKGSESAVGDGSAATATGAGGSEGSSDAKGGASEATPSAPAASPAD